MSGEILIIDCGSQTAHLIGRRFRQVGVRAEFVDPAITKEEIINKNPRGLVISGGPASVYDAGAPMIDPDILNLGIPTLGICYGWQLMGKILGGEVNREAPEYAVSEMLEIKKPYRIFRGLQTYDRFHVVVSHGDSVTKLPDGFTILASTERVSNAAVVNPGKKLYGLQFHPEASHTEYGLEIIKNFAEDDCNIDLKPLDLNPQSIVESIRERVKDKKVVFAVSGGVDSTVAAYLVGKAIGRNLVTVYIDSGLMRPGTEEKVRYIFSDLINADLTVVHARERFLAALEGFEGAEEKRHKFGELYGLILRDEIQKSGASFLGQGTIQSDFIESAGTRHAASIKSHHNVGALPKDLGLELLEPLKENYKDEVRQIGRMIGLPEAVVMAHPFPGPGNMIRIVGVVTEHRLVQVVQADKIVEEEMKRAGLYGEVFQCFAVMTGTRSTAVRGDARAYGEVVAIRIYESEDVMTADWFYPPRQVLAAMSKRIVEEVTDVSRVVLDITTKPPATMEWE